MTKSLRLTIPKHHDVYLHSIASQMGCDTSEALNYLLWELRKSNHQFGDSLPQYQHPQAQQPTEYPQATAMSALSWQPQSPQAIRDFEASQELQEEIDPVIERLLSLGLESF